MGVSDWKYKPEIVDVIYAPLSTAIIIVILVVFILARRKPQIVNTLALNVDSFDTKEYWRCITHEFTHYEIFHIIANLAGTWSMRYLEMSMGIQNYFAVLFVCCAFEPIVSVLLLKKFSHSNQGSVGFSGVLFAVLTLHYTKENSFHFFGLDVPYSFRPFADLLLIQTLVPNASFFGHLAGIIIGYAIAWKLFFWVTPRLVYHLTPWIFLICFEDISGVPVFGNGGVGTLEWVPNEMSEKCQVCGEPFNSLYRRRHHCRYCGLLVCQGCSKNSAVINDKIERVCDPCSSLLLPVVSTLEIPGLKAWMKQKSNNPNTPAPTSALMFFGDLLDSDSLVLHKTAITIVRTALQRHTEAICNANLPQKLLTHCLHCSCEFVVESLDLLLSIIVASKHDIDISSLDPFSYLEQEDINSRRIGARLCYFLVHQQKLFITSAQDILRFIEHHDRYVTAFLLGSLSHELALPANEDDLTNCVFFSEETEPNPVLNGMQSALFELFRSECGWSTVASRYYASLLLERLTRNKDVIQSFYDLPFDHVLTAITINRPVSSFQEGRESVISLNLAVVLRRVWATLMHHTLLDRLSELFSATLMPLFEVLSVRNEKPGCGSLTSLQIIFLDVVVSIFTIEGIGDTLCSEQMRRILTDLANGDSPLAKKAQKSFETLFSTCTSDTGT